MAPQHREDDGGMRNSELDDSVYLNDADKGPQISNNEWPGGLADCAGSACQGERAALADLSA